MVNKRINNYRELQSALAELNTSKQKQEEVIKANVKSIQEALNPINMVKDYLKRAAGDSELHQDILKAGIGLGSKFIIEKLVGSNKNVKRHFFANAIERFVASFVNK